MLDAPQAAPSAGGDDAAFVREVGAPAVQAIEACGRGDHDTAVERLRTIRSQAHRFGGSHAHRDVLDLTLLEAALRGGRPALGAAPAAERMARRPAGPPAARMAGRAAQR